MNGRLSWRVALSAIVCFTATRAMAAGGPDVTLKDLPASYILDNGIVTAQIDKKSGDLASLKFSGKELLAVDPTVMPGHWYDSPQAKYPSDARVTIDPSTNAGDRAEVEISGILFASDPKPPATMPSETIKPLIRYTLGRDEKGIYTYQKLEIHESNRGAFPPFRGDFILRLNDRLFDHLTVDKKISRDMPTTEDWKNGMPLNISEARQIQTGPFRGQVFCKYDNDMRAIDAPAFGWSGKKNGVGIWIVNPSTEYICNPLRVVSTGWLGDKSGIPILANCWGVQTMSGDDQGVYEGPREMLASTLSWSKIIGPFFILCNSGSFEDAVAQQKKAAAKWPFAWVQMNGFIPHEQRSTVQGSIRLDDKKWTMLWNQQQSNLAELNSAASRYSPATKPTAVQPLKNLLVGLTSPAPSGREWDEWQSDVGTGGQSPFANDQFWTRSEDGIHFTIPNVPPGTYTLHAIADGVLGEFTVQKIVVQPVQPGTSALNNTLDLGQAVWKVQRLGPQLWEIGTPNRTGDKFLHGDDFRHWGLYTLYPSEFPNDVNFRIDGSSEKKDWNYQQPLGTTWTIHFLVQFLPQPPANSSSQQSTPMQPGKQQVWIVHMSQDQGHQFQKQPPMTIPPNRTAPNIPVQDPSHLWIAYANNSGSQLTRGRRLVVKINGIGVGGSQAGFHEKDNNQPDPPFDDKTVFRDGIQGVWSMDVFFIPIEDLQMGDNVLTLQAIAPENPNPNKPAGGIIYDYLRWEQGDFPGREQFMAPDGVGSPPTP